MAVTLLQPVLPWSGAQEEDRRFRRILLAVMATASVLGMILPRLPVSPTMPERAVDEAPPVVRMITRPVSPFAQLPLQRREAESTAATERAPETVPETPAVVVDQTRTPDPGPRSGEPAAGESVRRTSPRAAQSGRDGREALPPARPPADRARAAREKAARTGVLAFSDHLRSVREFTPSTPAPGAGVGEGARVDDRAEATAESSLLKQGVAGGSGGIGRGIPGSRELLGTPEIQRPGGGAGGLAAVQSPAVGGSRAPVRRKARSEEEIQAVLDRQKSAIYALYERALRKDSRLQGKMVVSITIAPSGKVTHCGIEYSELKSDTLQKQLIRLIKAVDFGAKADVPTVTTKVPIEFFPV